MFNVFYLWRIRGDHETWWLYRLKWHFGNWKSSSSRSADYLGSTLEAFWSTLLFLCTLFPPKRVREVWDNKKRSVLLEWSSWNWYFPSFCLWNNRFLSNGWCLSPPTDSDPTAKVNRLVINIRISLLFFGKVEGRDDTRYSAFHVMLLKSSRLFRNSMKSLMEILMIFFTLPFIC